MISHTQHDTYGEMLTILEGSWGVEVQLSGSPTRRSNQRECRFVNPAELDELITALIAARNRRWPYPPFGEGGAT